MSSTLNVVPGVNSPSQVISEPTPTAILPRQKMADLAQISINGPSTTRSSGADIVVPTTSTPSDLEPISTHSSRRLSRANFFDKVSGLFGASPIRSRTHLGGLMDLPRDRLLLVVHARGSISTPPVNLAANLSATLSSNPANANANSNSGNSTNVTNSSNSTTSNINSNMNSPTFLPLNPTYAPTTSTPSLTTSLAPPYSSLTSIKPNDSILSIQSRTTSPVKETNRVFLEFDPISRRKVLNTYAILRQIGHGEHGKVKLAKDLESNTFVAIKIVNRKSKKGRPSLRKRSDPKAKSSIDEYEQKIKREIAIMKKCDHKYIVKLKEVLDDCQSHKIYLVLEYLEKGEIKWKRKGHESPDLCKGNELPCQFSSSMKRLSTTSTDSEGDLMSDDFKPNLTFKQARRVLRNVILGLEYLHKQGIVHRDIKPANLLVSSNNDVKISDFGVSFASSLDGTNDGYLVNEMELAKTAGTPVFFAPELCTVNSPSTSLTSMSNAFEMSKLDPTSTTSSTPLVDHKIDIWALGITLYCILFGKVPFIAESEFKLFEVIVHQKLEFPESSNSFGSPASVTQEEFELAKDLLTKMLDKKRDTRIDIPEIKMHPFVLMDLEHDEFALNEFIYLNEDPSLQSNPLEQHIVRSGTFEKLDVLAKDIDAAVVGIGNRICRNLASIMYKNKASSGLGELCSTGPSSGSSSETFQATNMVTGTSEAHSMILSEGALYVPKSQTPVPRYGFGSPINNPTDSHPHTPSGLSSIHATASRSSSGSAGGSRELRAPSYLQEIIDSQSPNLSRRGSLTGSTEAPMIETKRNVVGDVYLTNQTAIDAFKGIQKQDDKIRRLSILSLTINPTSGSVHTSDISSPPNPNDGFNPSSSDNILTGGNRNGTDNVIGIGGGNGNLEAGKPTTAPIDISHSLSVAISLPLNGSLASLDSFSDEYLAEKYFPDKAKITLRRRSSSTSQLDDYHEFKPLAQVSEQLKSFNMQLLMNPKKNITFDLDGDDGDPRSRKPKANLGYRQAVVMSSSSSEASDDSNEDDDDDDGDGNLTLAFSLKVKPSSRPNFLLIDNRSKSHDSRLPSLLKPSYELPIYITGQEADVEDLPEGLISSVPRPSISLASGITPTVSVLSSTTSSATITPTLYMRSSSEFDKSKVIPEFQLPTSNEPPIAPQTPVIKLDKSRVRIASPLRLETRADGLDVRDLSYSSDILDRESLSIGPESRKTPVSLLSSQFNNHYRKSSLASPSFQPSTISEDDPEHQRTYRSNSITVGILQRDSSQDS